MKYVVVTESAIKLPTTTVSPKTTSAQAIPRFKKSTLNLEQPTSADAGTKLALFCCKCSPQNIGINPHLEACANYCR